MQITLSRKWLYVLLVVLVALPVTSIVVASQQSAVAGTTPGGNMASEVTQLARDLAMAFGKGDLYRSPDRYPLTDSLKASIAKIPNRGQVWPEFVGLTGDVVVVLQGKDASNRSFTDVVAHVLSKGANSSTQLTQVDLRMIHEGGTWKADRLLTLAKGSVQP